MARQPAPDPLVCTACGAGLPATAKFCLECGTPVPGAVDRETRRTVTLLFTDVTGSTALGELLDPESYRGIMGRYFEVARAAVERHGGWVEKFVGDAVLAVFGVPAIHEDDALRAVRAARDLNDAVADLAEEVLAELGVRLAIRTGVNTGSVVAGSARAGGSFATGDAVNTAARLEQAAAPGQILLGDPTYHLVRDAVEVEGPWSVSAKGKAEPVHAYRLLKVYATRYGHSRREDSILIGRESETWVLTEAFERTIASGHSHLVTVLGPPGIGKSRLVGEFVARVGERAEVAQGRCVSYGRGITYWPLVQALRDTLHLVGTESDETTRHALESALGRAPDRDDVITSLLPLLGKTGTPPGKDQTFWSVRRLLEEVASRRPLVLNIDDLHWAEPTLLEFLELLGTEVSELPLFVLCQARPELLEQHPGWGSGAPESLTFGLDPLSRADIEASVAALLDGEMPEGFADAVSERSGGNPLFVEEIVAHLIETDVLKEQPDGRWEVVGDLATAELPPTVTALLAARLEGLPTVERDLLERLSVIGLEFSTSDATLLAGERSATELTSVLASLTRRDLVQRKRSPQDDSWAFKHVLVRDAAYDGLSKSLRSELHERFADGLLARDEAEAAGEQAGLVAHHLEQAARFRRELGTRGPEVKALVHRAVDALCIAAGEARDRERFEDHAGYLRRALRLEPPAPAITRRLLAGLSDNYREALQLDRFGDVLDTYEATFDGSEVEVDLAFLVTMRLQHELLAGAAVDPAQVSRAAEDLVTLGRAADDPGSVVRGLLVRAECAAMLGLWQDGAAYCDGVIRIGSPAQVREALEMQSSHLYYGSGSLRAYRDVVVTGDRLRGRSELRDVVAMVLDATVLAADGSPDAGRALRAAEVRAAELYAAGGLTAPTPGFLAQGYMLARDLDSAIASTQVFAAWLRGGGALSYASTSLLEQALLMLERGDRVEYVVPLVEEASGYLSPYDVISVSYFAASRAILAARAEDLPKAVALTDEALRRVDGTQQVWAQADLRRWLSVVPRTTGDVIHERRLLLEAIEMYHRKEICSYDPEIEARLAELGP